jgi:NADH-quinone oxidoreductase subunit D/NADH-quinone oxidoreductase subunit C/D
MAIHLKTLNEILHNLNKKKSWGTKEYFINMGPQHPSTHGVLRLILKLKGEVIQNVMPILGYIHRGIEKIGESVSYRNFVHLTDRCDYFSSIINNWGVSKTIEDALKIELNPRIETIRTIFAEIQRLQSHTMWWGVFGMDLGAFTPFFYGFRDREFLTSIVEDTCGSRLTMNYIQPGGVLYDIKSSFVKKMKSYINYLRPRIKEYEDLISNNIIVQKRIENIGILNPKDAISLGATGPVLRASGIPLDLRKDHAYGVYNNVKFSTVIGTKGDSWDRYWIRIEEMRQSLDILEQLLDNIPSGKHLVIKYTTKIKLPIGYFSSSVETARGILGIFIASDAKEYPYRIHMRSPNYNNLWTITKLAVGLKISDLVAIISTLDLIIPDVDR